METDMDKIRKLIEVANSLDAKGLIKEAELIDSILRKIAMDSFDDEDFEPSDSELQAIELGLYDPVEEDKRSTLQRMLAKLQREMEIFGIAISEGRMEESDWEVYLDIQKDLSAIIEEADRSAREDEGAYKYSS